MNKLEHKYTVNIKLLYAILFEMLLYTICSLNSESKKKDNSIIMYYNLLINFKFKSYQN